MQSYPLETASVDGQYNYHDARQQNQQYQQLELQIQIQRQEQQQQQQQQQQSQALVLQSHPDSFPQVKKEEFQTSSQQLSLIPHIATTPVQAPTVRTAYNTQAIRKYHHRQQDHRSGPRLYRYNPERRQQVRLQHQHQHNNHQSPYLQTGSPRQASKPRRRPARFSRDKEASLRCWLSEYINTGDFQGNDIVNLDEVEHASEMDGPLPHTPTSSKSMALSPSQNSNGLVLEFSHHHNKDKDGQQTPQTLEVKNEVDHTDAALWGLVPFNTQELVHAQGQMQSSFSTGHELLPYSNTIAQPVSPFHSHMISMPAIQEVQESQFDPLGTGYHQHSMDFVGNAFRQQPQQQQQQGPIAGLYTTALDSIHMSNPMSFSNMSTGSGERQCARRGASGVSMARSRSNIEVTTNPGFASPTSATIQDLQITAPGMSRSVSTRTLAASENSHQSQQLPPVDPSLAPIMSQTAPMQHSLSAQSASSGSSFISHSALHPLFAPSMIPSAFYDTGTILGEPQSHYLNVQRASNKRSASCMGSHLPPQNASKRRMDEFIMVKEERSPTPCSSGNIPDSSFNFDDYIDLASSQRITDVTATGSSMGPGIVRYDGSAEQTMSAGLMHSIEMLSSEAVRHTALVTAVTPHPHDFEHNDTVSPHDLVINPLSDPGPIVKRESVDAPQQCMAMVSNEHASFFAEFDPILVGGYQGRSADNDSNAAELDLAGRGIEDFYPYGSSIGSPRIPHPSPASDLSPSSFHNQHQPSPHNSHDAHALQDPGLLPVPRSATCPIDAAETEIVRMRAAEEQRHAECERRRKDHILLQLKREGYTYREIRAKGNFTEAESTLRGRYRTLTKAKQERVRKPTWTADDDRLLIEAVNFMARGRVIGHFKVAWKAVSERIVDNGGSYRFGNTTCRKRYDLLVEQGLVRESPNTSYDDAEEEEDDEPSVVYFNEENYGGAV